MNKSLDEHGWQFAWDATSIAAAEKCPRYYQLSVLDGWRAKLPNAHLFFGIIYANALEHHAKHMTAGKTYDEALREVVREALVSSWVDGEPWKSTHNLKTRENLIRTIVWYFEHFRNDTIDIVQLANGKPAVELSFSFEVDDDVMFCGHLDRLCDYGDKHYVMDQKTTGSTLAPSYFKQFMNDTQMSMYSFAGKGFYKLPIKGVIIDAAQVAVGFTRFERGFVFRSDQQLEEWYTDTMQTVAEMRRYAKNDYFPMRRSSCNNYGGCDFREICIRSPEVRNAFLKTDFTQEEGPWDPLDRR